MYQAVYCICSYRDTKSVQKKMEEQEEKVIIVVIQKLFQPYARVDLWTHKFANFLNFAGLH